MTREDVVTGPHLTWMIPCDYFVKTYNTVAFNFLLTFVIYHHSVYDYL